MAKLPWFITMSPVKEKNNQLYVNMNISKWWGLYVKVLCLIAKVAVCLRLLTPERARNLVLRKAWGNQIGN